MSDTPKISQSDKMKEHWRQVRAGIIPQHRKRKAGPTQDLVTAAPVATQVETNPASPPKPIVTVQTKPGLSPFCASESVEFPMPTMVPTVEHIAPEEQQPLARPVPQPVRPAPVATKPAPGGVVQVGRKVPVKFTPPAEPESRKVIVQLGRKLR